MIADTRGSSRSPSAARSPVATTATAVDASGVRTTRRRPRPTAPWRRSRAGRRAQRPPGRPPGRGVGRRRWRSGRGRASGRTRTRRAARPSTARCPQRPTSGMTTRAASSDPRNDARMTASPATSTREVDDADDGADGLGPAAPEDVAQQRQLQSDEVRNHDSPSTSVLAADEVDEPLLEATARRGRRRASPAARTSPSEMTATCGADALDEVHDVAREDDGAAGLDEVRRGCRGSSRADTGSTASNGSSRTSTRGACTSARGQRHLLGHARRVVDDELARASVRPSAATSSAARSDASSRDMPAAARHT